jgi:hypothetical protein
MIRRTLVIVATLAVGLTLAATPALAASGRAGSAHARCRSAATDLPRAAGAGTELTVAADLPPLTPVKYPKSVDLTGHLTTDGLPPATPQVVQVGQTSGDSFTPVASAKTDASGFYRAAVTPTSNGTWTAVCGDVRGNEVAIEVAPRVTLALSHVQAAARLTEIFSGVVAPKHAGMRVLIQKAVRGGMWQMVASGRLDSRSRYRVTWNVPYKTARYRLRAILPAHPDHAQGTSMKAVLKVVVRQG